MLNDAVELVKACEAYQFHAKQIHQPTGGLQTIPLTWPFAVWGLDILGPFPRAPGGYRYLYIVVYKFTKWAEVEAVRTIPAGSAVKFIKGIMSRFGVPNRIITDNVRSSPATSSKHTMLTLERRYATFQWCTPEATARPSGPMQRS